MRARGLARTAVGVVAAALVVTGSVASGSTPTPVAGSSGIGDPYFPLDGNGGIDVQHYAIADSYDLTSRRLSGTTTLTLRATEALSSFDLDFLLPVSSVSVGDTPAGFSQSQPHELRITPATPLTSGAVVDVTVTYAGNPSTLSYAGEANWLASGSEVVAMNEPHMAPWWFPSDDHPADKATFDVAITTDAGLQVISNGTEGSRTVDGAHATTRWHEDEPMATYLAFFAAGHFLVSHGTTDGIPWTTAVSRGYSRARQRHYRALLGQSGAITAWLQHELGPYPFDSIGGLVTRLDPGFALENQTRPTYPWWVDHSTVVHELAHQWFGDSVSLRRWRDVWLNEGFATYMEQRWREDHGGPTTRQWLHAAYRALAGDHAFWQIPVASPGVDDIWSNAVYVRGAMTLAALRVRIGSQDFRTLLRTWVAEHRYGNGIIPQFEALAHRVSGQRLDGFFRAWLLDREPPARTAANGW